MKRRKASSSMKNRTWWNELRIKEDFSLEEIADYTNYSGTAVGNFLSGRVMPTESFIEKCCELFGVEVAEGKQHFVEAYEARSNERTKEKASQDNAELLESLYGKVDYETFMKLYKITKGES